jgi:hypothetical protein
MPTIPDDYPWAQDERPRSTHQTSMMGFFNYTANQFGLAFVALFVGGLLLSAHFLQGPQTNTLIPGLLFGSLSIPCVIWAVVSWNGIIKEVRLYDDGVLWLDNGRWRGAAFEDIAEVYRREVRINGQVSLKHVEIVTQGRKKAIFEHALSKWSTLADRLQMKVASIVGPEIIAAFQAGDEISFGKGNAISLEGLTLDRKSMDWDAIQKLEVRNGSVVAWGGRNKAIEAILGDMPNYPVFLKLLELSPGPEVS